MRVFSHPACLAHEPGPTHAERPDRLRAVTDALRNAFVDLEWADAPQATREQLLRVHDEALVTQVLDARIEVLTQLDPDTFMSAGSAEAALRCAGAGVAAVEAVMGGRERHVFCAVRPPGHHATGGVAMGFCLFNSIAVAAAHALAKHGLQRVAIVDFDVHHGNGTQAIFESEPRVLFASSHQLPLYPDTGQAHERGVGNILNAPLAPGTGGEGFRATWQDQLLPRIDAFAPELVMISAGFDAHRLDPLAQLELEADDYRWITAELVAIAERHAQGRLVSMLEGGYDLDGLRESSVAHVGVLRSA